MPEPDLSRAVVLPEDAAGHIAAFLTAARGVTELRPWDDVATNLVSWLRWKWPAVPPTDEQVDEMIDAFAAGEPMRLEQRPFWPEEIEALSAGPASLRLWPGNRVRFKEDWDGVPGTVQNWHPKGQDPNRIAAKVIWDDGLESTEFVEDLTVYVPEVDA